MTEFVRYRVTAGIATVTLDSPHNRNALSAQLVSELLASLETAGADAAVRAVELTHTGSVFCAGADLSEASAANPATEGATALMRTIVELDKPVVATVAGHVRAGGLGLIGAADIVLADRERSTFAFSEARIGVTPAIISMTTLGRMSQRSASRYYLTGSSFDADEAARIGLITEAADDVAAAAATVFADLRLCSPQGLREAKRLTTASTIAALDEQSADLADLSARLFDTDEAREGMAAFLAKRPAKWVTA